MSALSGFRIQRAIPIYISTDGSCFTRNCLQFRSCTTCIVYVISSKIARLELASLFRESGCKGKEFFAYPPNFRGTFLKFFFRGVTGTGAARERATSAWASLCERREGARREGRERGTGLHHVKHQGFPRGSGCKSTHYHRTGKRKGGFFSRFSEEKRERAGFQACCGEGVRGGMKNGEREGHNIYIAGGGARTLYNWSGKRGKRMRAG